MRHLLQAETLRKGGAGGSVSFGVGFEVGLGVWFWFWSDVSGGEVGGFLRVVFTVFLELGGLVRLVSREVEVGDGSFSIVYSFISGIELPGV